jgi:hypothetical protein
MYLDIERFCPGTSLELTDLSSISPVSSLLDFQGFNKKKEIHIVTIQKVRQDDFREFQRNWCSISNCRYDGIFWDSEIINFLCSHHGYFRHPNSNSVIPSWLPVIFVDRLLGAFFPYLSDRRF